MVRVFFWDIHFVVNYHFVVIFVSVFFVDFHFVVVHRFIITEWMAQGDLWNFKGDSRYMTYEFILCVLSISMMQKSEAGKHQKQHMQKSWDARHWDRVKAFWKLCGRILDHESWRTLQGLAHDWYCLMAWVKVLGYIVDDGHVVGRNVKEAMNPRKLQSLERHWKQRKKRIDCWSFARFVACGTVLSCFVNMFWAVSVDDFDMPPYSIYALDTSFCSFRMF